MSATESDVKASDAGTSATAPVPKRIVNAQTVCNERNAKGKLCNGHLKQLRTAGEPAEVHLRGDDVLSKCQTCGTLYMGPPLGHVRDPNKQYRFVEAELTALLQAAGGTLPVVKKDARGVFVMVEAETSHGAAKAPAAAPAAKAAAPPKAAAASPAATPPAAKAATSHKAGANPNRQLFRRTTYAGVKDTGPVPGESFEQKVARLRAVSAAAKQRAEEGGEEVAASDPAASLPPAITPAIEAIESSAPLDAAALSSAVSESSPAATHKPTGQADRSLMRRSTYGAVVDTGPVAGESFAEKVERLRKVSAAAKERAEGN